MTLKYLRLLISLFLFIRICSPGYAQVNTQDSLALIDLYDSTNGDSWYNNTNWKTTAPLSTWQGVLVSNNRVVTLNFAGNNLIGFLPTSIGNLTGLKSLTLLNNQISGGLPSVIGNLVLLEQIKISANQFGGSIPASFGNLKKAKRISMYGCALTGNIPSSFKNLDSLQVLELDMNSLSGDFSNSIPLSAALSISVNHFTFDGIEQWASIQPDPSWFFYASQANVALQQIGDKLAVSAGGTPANDTFSWYKSNGELVEKKVGDSTFLPASPGSYYVEVTNAIAKNLILKSDSATAVGIGVTACANQNITLQSDIVGFTYQWQVSTDSVSYIDLTDNTVYSGVQTSSLTIKAASSAMYGNRYRCKVDSKLGINATILFKNNWTGNNSLLWNDVDNWSCGSIPDENTDVVVSSGAVVVVDADVTVHSLQVSPGAQVVVTSGHKLIVKH